MQMARTQRASATIRNNLQGAATTEFMISLVLFIPLFISVPVLGKYLSFKQKNIESNRYVVWERTVWADNDGRWHDDENTKTDDGIAREVDRRFYGSQIQGLASDDITDNSLWTDVSKNRMLALAPKGKHRISVALATDDSPVRDRHRDSIAFNGIPAIGEPVAKIANMVESTLGKFISACDDIPGVDLQRGMNLGSRTYAGIAVAANVNNVLQHTETNSSEARHLRFLSRGSILSNAWTAPNEAVFNQRVGKLVIDDGVRCTSSPARLIAYFPLYKEGRDAKNVVSSEKSTVLLEDYKP